MGKKEKKKNNRRKAFFLGLIDNNGNVKLMFQQVI